MDLTNLIGKGMSGKVFFPALPCADNKTVPSNYVSKLVTNTVARKELEAAKTIKNFYQMIHYTH
jgi:hypothetical protein